MNERKLEWCLFAKWSEKRREDVAQKDIHLLLGRRGAKSLLHELRERVNRGGDSKVPYDTFIVVCALFCRGQDSFEKIKSAVSKCKMAQMLFAGYRIFLNGGRHGAKVLIQYNDEDVPNHYEWISHWEGMGYHSILSEIFMVSRLLHELDQSRFWQMAKEDPSDLILLNWTKIFWGQLTTEQAMELLTEGDSVRRKMLGFWHLAPASMNNARLEEDGESLLTMLNEVPETVLYSCLYEFLVTEPACPKGFRDYLLKPSRDELLRQEIMRTKMLTSPREALHVAALVCEISNKRRQMIYWNILKLWLETEVEKGALVYNVRDLKLATELFSMFPELHKEQMEEKFRNRYQNLHAEILDYIIRPSIHRREAAKKAIIEQLIPNISGCRRGC